MAVLMYLVLADRSAMLMLLLPIH